MNSNEDEPKERMGFESHFERNRYFDGKLITADDMEIEQQYHAERLNTINRSVIGGSLVYGLKASISEATDTQLTVTIQPGLALDRHGRPILVIDETAKEIDKPSTDDTTIYLYLSQDLQPWETVPTPLSKSSSTNQCEYNRIVERPHFELTTDEKSDIPDGDVPKIDISTDDRRSIAEQYYAYTVENETQSQKENPTKRDPILVGSFEKSADISWPETEFKPGPLVYHNDMLYTILANHILDFDNPHQLETTGSGNWGNLENRFISSDGSIGIESRNSKINLKVTKVIQDDLQALHQHYRARILNSLRWNFNDVATKFDSNRRNRSVAGNIHRNLTYALEESHSFLESDAFLEFSEDNLLGGEMLTSDSEDKYGLIQLKDDLDGRATEASLERYSTALSELREAIDTEGTSRYTLEDERELEVITAQYNLNEAVNRLERHITEPENLPIDVLPGINHFFVDIFGEDDVRTVSELSYLKTGEVEDITGVSEELASLWIEKAKELIP